MINADAFNFDALKQELGTDPFANTSNNRNTRDERFYVLQKDKNGSGAALIRFLPDSERAMIQKVNRINTTVVKNGKKRFVNEISPSTIGSACPFQERWQELWNAGQKDESKLYGRVVKYITNIKVIKDPANPENEGKIFLYEMSGAMKDKIQSAVDPSEQDRALGAQPKELFNPLRGNSFRLVARKGANGQINYDSSEVVNDVTSIYGSVEEALEDIKNNTHKLSDLVKPEAFLSYEELKQKLNWVTFANEGQGAQGAQGALNTTVASNVQQVPEINAAQSVQAAQPAETTQPQQPTSNQTDLDSLLNGLI